MAIGSLFRCRCLACAPAQSGGWGPSFPKSGFAEASAFVCRQQRLAAAPVVVVRVYDLPPSTGRLEEEVVTGTFGGCGRPARVGRIARPAGVG